MSRARYREIGICRAGAARAVSDDACDRAARACAPTHRCRGRYRSCRVASRSGGKGRMPAQLKLGDDLRALALLESRYRRDRRRCAARRRRTSSRAKRRSRAPDRAAVLGGVRPRTRGVGRKFPLLSASDGARATRDRHCAAAWLERRSRAPQCVRVGGAHHALAWTDRRGRTLAAACRKRAPAGVGPGARTRGLRRARRARVCSRTLRRGRRCVAHRRAASCAARRTAGDCRPRTRVPAADALEAR